MKTKHTSRIAVAAALAAAALSLVPAFASGDSFDDALAENPDRFAGLFHSYEFCEIRDTPPPAGYEPVYVSHYGRHGSRRQMAGFGTPAYEAMAKADAAGLLTDEGRRLFADVSRIRREHVDMEGELTERGGLEHRMIAKRMHARFPSVFAGGRTVRCQASTVPRCLVSMANFAVSLEDAAPGIRFTFHTGEKYRSTLARHYDVDEGLREAHDRFKREMIERTVDAEPLVRRIFADVPEARSIVGDPREFALHLFFCACACQCLEKELGGLDISGFFSPSELNALARFNDMRIYASLGNSAEFRRQSAKTAAAVAADIAERADAALSDPSVAADLRFGHDSGLWPLVGLVGLAGTGAVVPAADSPTGCPCWKNMPMGSNLQIVFFRNASGDVIVKLLFNERETEVVGLEPVAGPFYRWSDLRGRLEAHTASK